MSTIPTTRNKATVRRLYDAINTPDAELISKTIDEVFDPDVLAHNPVPLQATGAQLVKEVLAVLHRAFPDLRVTIEDMIEEGDKVVSGNTITGTHRGECLGRPPSGTSVTDAEIFIMRFVNARIGEMWGRRRLLADETARRSSGVAQPHPRHWSNQTISSNRAHERRPPWTPASTSSTTQSP